MLLHKNEKGKLLYNRDFRLFFMSQTFLGLGGYIQLTAVASLFMKYTNSGLSTGLSIICAPLPGILLSLLAGSMGDRLPNRKFLVFLDLSRGILTFMFFSCKNVLSVFALLLLLNSADALYNPSRNKLLASITGKKNLITGNSILSGGYGAVSIISPAAAGMIIGAFGVNPAFIVNGISYFISAFLLLKIKNGQNNYGIIKFNKRISFKDIQDGVKYSFRIKELKSAITTNALIEFGTVSVNISFYAFAFDILKVSGRLWGLMLSIVYGMNFISMLILLRCKDRFEKRPLLIIHPLLIAVSAVWCFYSISTDIPHILIAEAAEGLCLSICGTLLLTYILKIPKKEYTARVIGARDVVSNSAKLAGVCASYLFIKAFNPCFMFIFCSAVFLIFNSIKLFKALTVRQKKD